MNEVLETKAFWKSYLLCQPNEKKWIDGIKEQLKENLFVGKQLRFYWLREKKYGDKRLYYIINDKSKKALLIAYSTKKGQQETIDRIILNKEYYFQFIQT